MIERYWILQGAGWELIGAQRRAGCRTDAARQLGVTVLLGQQRRGSVLGEWRKRLFDGVGCADVRRCWRGVQR